MIRRLKFKLIIINTAITFLIIAAAFGVIYLNSYKNYYEQSIDAMEGAVKNSFAFDPFFGVGDMGSRETDIVAFYATVSDDGSVGTVIAPMHVEILDEARFEKMVKDCLESGEEIGTIRSEKLRYMITENRIYGRVVAFADISDEIDSLAVLVTTGLIVSLAVILAVAVLSLILSNWAVAPVKSSIERQNRFIADASHELKTPITVILANTDIIASNPEKTVSSQEKWLSYIGDEARDMKTLVEDMLTLAKSDGRKNEAKLSSVCISDIVSAAVLPFESLTFEQNKSLKAEIVQEIYAKADPSAIERLTGILLDNAVKYCNDNGQIEVYLYRSRKKIHLTVRNSGEPISKEAQKHIFDRFYRPDDARARSTGGFGLGLSIAKDIAKKHRGRLYVESNDSIGTAFTLEIPQ